MPRTLIIGLDGATFDVIDPLVRAGYLPTLERLMARGTRAVLNSFPDMNSAAAWSTMVTGQNAGAHGIFHFDRNWYRLSQRGIKAYPSTAAQRRRDPFWRILSRAGQRVGVVNVPISFPADVINGFMLAGMDAPSVHSKRFCHPESLYDELAAQGIAYEIDTLNLGPLAHRAPFQLPAQIKRMVDARARALLYLMDTREWDAVMGVFVATDRVQHYFWYAEDADVRDPSWQPLRELYQQLDSFLADALRRAGTDTNLLIVSDHGFGRKRGAQHTLNDLFSQLGLLHFAAHPRDVGGTLLASLLRMGRRFMPSALQYPLARLFPALHLRALTASGFAKIDWARTQVFADPDGWGVYVNLAGREPEGIVRPEDYQTVCARVREILMDACDAETNERVVRAAYLRHELFHGEYAERAPDLLIDWNFETLGDELQYADNRTNTVAHTTRHSASEQEWNATHRPAGILIAHGPGIQRGAVIPSVSLADIAPTILYLQREPVPHEIDGTAIRGLFTPEFLEAYPPAISQAPAFPAADLPIPDATDMHLVTERLRALGYLEP